MNKAELITTVKTELGLDTNVAAEANIKVVVEAIIAGAIADGECAVPGLGKLQVVETAPKAARSGEVNGVAYTTEAKPAGKKFKLNVLKDGKARL